MILRDVKCTPLMLTLPAAAAKSLTSVAMTMSLHHLHEGSSLLLFYLCSTRHSRWKQQAGFMEGRNVETQS